MSQLVPFLNFGLEDSSSYLMDNDNNLFYSNNNNHLTCGGSVDVSKMFITLDGLNSGVPTITTPTLTPTTLRDIHQTFTELQATNQKDVATHQNAAGFVPPRVPSTEYSNFNDSYTLSSELDLHSSKSNSWHSQSGSDSNSPTPSLTPASVTGAPTRRNMGGRKPNKNLSLSPEEEERRKVRRERNKMAAARCRKRRVDHTNTLLEEVDGLEQKKQALQTEIQQLRTDLDELESILETHQAFCRLQNSRPASPPDVKPYIYAVPAPHMEKKQLEMVETASRIKSEMHESVMFNMPSNKKVMPMMSSTIPISRPSRPNSLNVGATFPLHKSAEEVAGMALSTPSAGIPFNFESMMVGGTGLTPVAAPITPSCSTQQRNLPPNVDMSSPDANGPPKLVSL